MKISAEHFSNVKIDTSSVSQVNNFQRRFFLKLWNWLKLYFFGTRHTFSIGASEIDFLQRIQGETSSLVAYKKLE